jgi:hypothetical protein
VKRSEYHCCFPAVCSTEPTWAIYTVGGEPYSGVHACPAHVLALCEVGTSTIHPIDPDGQEHEQESFAITTRPA